MSQDNTPRARCGKPKAEYPSVTTILSKTKDMAGILAWRRKVGAEKADRILRKAAGRGTRLHTQIEGWLDNFEEGEGLWWDSIAPVIKARVRRVVWLERAIWFEHDALAFFGIADCLAYFDDVLTLIDWKTARTPKREEHVWDYKLQAAAYAKACRQRFPDTCGQLEQTAIIISCTNEGKVDDAADKGKTITPKALPAQVFVQRGAQELGVQWRAFTRRVKQYKAQPCST